MPTYEYHCKACNHHYELNSSHVGCPDCKKELQLTGYEGVTLKTMAQLTHLLINLQRSVQNLQERVKELDDEDDEGDLPPSSVQ